MYCLPLPFTSLVKPFFIPSQNISLYMSTEYCIGKMKICKWGFFTFVYKYVSECMFIGIVEINIICFWLLLRLLVVVHLPICLTTYDMLPYDKLLFSLNNYVRCRTLLKVLVTHLPFFGLFSYIWHTKLNIFKVFYVWLDIKFTHSPPTLLQSLSVFLL